MLVQQRGVAFDPRVVDAFANQVQDMIALRERINANPPSFEQLAELA